MQVTQSDRLLSRVFPCSGWRWEGAARGAPRSSTRWSPGRQFNTLGNVSPEGYAEHQNDPQLGSNHRGLLQISLGQTRRLNCHLEAGREAAGVALLVLGRAQPEVHLRSGERVER